MRRVVPVWIGLALLIPLFANPPAVAAAPSRTPAVSASPGARAAMGMAYDLATRRAVLFGGEGRFGELSDTWQWDGSVWRQASSVGLPTPRGSPGFAYDGGHGKIVMFGGQFCSEFGCQALADTWLWNGSRWTRVRPANAPSGRVGPAEAFDLYRRRVVLFGGATTVGTNMNDTWTWDGTNWTHRTPATSPPADPSTLAGDPARRRVVLFNSAGETWTWDGSNWTQQHPVQSPAPRFDPVMAFDAARGNVVLFGGRTSAGADLADTWTWDGSNWTQETPVTSPPPRSSAGMAYDLVNRNAVLEGGIYDCTPTCSFRDDTWLWDGTNWTQPNPPTGPSARHLAAMATDLTRANTVLFGGEDVDGQQLADTWTWDGSAWTKLSPATSPPGRYGAVMAWDPVTQSDLLFGGCCDPNSPSGYWNDTWSWNGTTWTELQPAHVPNAREDSAAATDFARNRVVLFGGCCVIGLNAFGDTWTWNGTDWTKRTPALPPSPRKGHAMAWDPTGNRVILFGGYDDQTPHSDQTWAWTGSEWTQLFPATTVPHERSFEGMATDVVNNNVVMFGGVGGLIGILGDTWIWTGTDWSQRSPATTPLPRQDQSMAWDPGGQDVLMFGGCCASNGQTWTWDGTNWKLQPV